MNFELPDFAADSVGQCECCYEEDVELCTVPGYLCLCRNCYENELTLCQNCGDSYLYEAIEWYEDADGNSICEYCAEELGLTEEE